MMRNLKAIAFGLGLVLAGGVTAPAQAAQAGDVVKAYADIAHAMYEDSLITAKTLRSTVASLIAKPTRVNLIRARAAWLAARVPYQQTEGYRFGNALVDDWEGKVNAWPLDEGLIDYVAASYGDASDDNPYFTANVIANKSLKLGGRMVDVSVITPALLAETLHEIDEVEANVATGYHAVEFLLWGQDLNGTGQGAGNRPHTDFDPRACTGGNCERRAQYLRAVTDLLISDLKDIVAAWAPGGEARTAATVAGIVKGLGSLSYGELAGERTKLGLMLHDPEEEHDCFADNTHNSHYYNQVGMVAIYQGRYARIDGSLVEGPGLKDLVMAKAPDVANKVERAMAQTTARMQIMKDLADQRVMSYDQMLGEGNTVGNNILQDVVDGLVVQAKALEMAMVPLGLSGIDFEGSDSLDAPEKVGN